MHYPALLFFFSSLLLQINPNFACSFLPVEQVEIKCLANDWQSEEDSQQEQQCASSSVICALFTGEGCDREVCQRYTSIQSGECSPCDDPSVRSFKDMPCTGEKVFCDPEHRPTNCVELHFDPVCGFNPDCDAVGGCSQDFKTPCGACADSTTGYYIRGRCLDRSNDDEKRTFCDPSYQVQCTDDDDDDDDDTDEPVCAHRRECSDLYLNPTCARTVRSGCVACNDPNIEFYTPGECRGEKIFCDPDNRPSEDEPITSCDPTACVYLSDCEGDDCRRENYPATACADSRAGYYILGACQ